MGRFALVTCLAVLTIGCSGAPVAPPGGVAHLEGFRRHAEVPGALDADALTRMRARAKSEKSTALIVLQDGKIVVEDYFGADPMTPTMAMSVTKSVVALGIGTLVDRKALTLDEALGARLFPELNNDPIGKITPRHLLNHTSGLPTRRYGMTQPPSWLTRTIEAYNAGVAPVAPPGEAFTYNNNAVDFLSAVARRAAPDNMYLDDWLNLSVFGPLRISGAAWLKDARGDVRGGGELLIRPIDLARIGQLVLQRGKWHGKQVVSEAWIDQMLAPGQRMTETCGLLWWRDGPAKAFVLSEARMKRWAKAGIDPRVVEAARPMRGERFDTNAQAVDRLTALLGGTRAVTLAGDLKAKRIRLFDRELDPIAYRADGWLGQYLIVVPSKRLVVVRMRDPRRTSWTPGEFSYPDLLWDVLALAGRPVPVEDR